MTPDELRPIVTAWGGVEKFARVLDVSNRTVSYWLAGKRKISSPVAKLIRSLKPPRKDKPQ
jgi:DNA-binding transcriptional regulator YiaG